MKGSRVLPEKDRYERVRLICALLVGSVKDRDDIDIVDLWISYRLLTLQIEKDLSEGSQLDQLIQDAYRTAKKDLWKVEEAATR